MTWEWLALAGPALGAVVLLLVVLLAMARLRARTAGEVAAAQAETAELRARLDRLEQVGAGAEPQVRDEREYLITGVGSPGSEAGAALTADESGRPPPLTRAVFADHVLREGVIRLGALAHGVRRGLDPETRNRIRFEMRREVKRARKERRTEQREAYREWRARQRGAVGEDGLDDRFRESA